jgi:tetratricopeptide (TPR) repeat protein
LYNQKKWNLAKNDFTTLLTLPAGETNTVYYRQDPFTENVNQVFTTQGSNHAYIFNYVGLTHMELKEFDRALTNFDSAIFYNPNDADYYVNAGRCYESVGKVEDARISYYTALDINPNHGLAKHNLGIINRNNGDPAGADGILEEVISKHPTLPYPYAERALIETNRGEFKKALKDFDEAIRLAPTEAEYRLGRGIVKEKMKDWAGAYDDFTKAIRLNENFEKAWLNRANILYKRGQYVEAIKDYDVAVLLSDTYAIAYYNRALAKYRTGQNAGACDDLKSAKSLGLTVKEKELNKICDIQ